MIQTDPGERSLAPDYGLSDPTFADFSRIELETKISDYGPPVVINSFSATRSNGRLDISIEFEPNTPEDESVAYDDSEDAFDPANDVVIDPTENI